MEKLTHLLRQSGYWLGLPLLVTTTGLGTEGFIEVRKNCDIAGRPGGNHLFLVDQKETQYIDCNDLELPYGRQLIADVVNRTETAMTQAHCFLASGLALKAQAQAVRLDNLDVL